MHAHQLWAILIINVKEHKRNLHKSGFWGHTKSYSLFFPLFNVVKTFLKQSFLSVFSGFFFFYHFDHFPSYSSNGQSRCRWLPKHWSPVIIIWRQPVLMLGRPWENFFLFMKRKTGSQECWIEQAWCRCKQQWLELRQRACTRCAYIQPRRGFLLLLCFFCVIVRFQCWQMFVTHVMMRVSSPGSPSTPSTNRGVLVKLYLFHCRPSSKLNLGTQTAVAEGAKLMTLGVV